MRKIIIKEEQLDFIKKNQAYVNNNSLQIFNKEIKKFLYCILTDSNKEISDYWRVNGVKKGDLFRLLKRYGIITEIQPDNSDDNPQESKVKIMVPKRNFNKKINRLYYELFDDLEPGVIMTEDGEGGDGGGTSCSSVGGSFEGPLFGIQRRKIANQ